MPEVGYWELIDPIWGDEKLIGTTEEVLQRFSELSEAQKTLYAAHLLDAEVCNGGFHQFFSNSTGELAPEAVDAFTALGLHKTAEIIREAIGVFGDPYPRKQDERNAFLDSFTGETEEEWNPFFKMDDEYYSSLKMEDGVIPEKSYFEIVLDEYAKKFL